MENGKNNREHQQNQKLGLLGQEKRDATQITQKWKRGPYDRPHRGEKGYEKILWTMGASRLDSPDDADKPN